MDTTTSRLLLAGAVTAAWCAGHSLFVTHAWRRFLARRLAPLVPVWRLAYVVVNTLTFVLLMHWLLRQPQRTLWDWPGAWALVRWAGLAGSLLLMWAGARAYDNRTFLGITQFKAWLQRRPPRESGFRQDGILARVRHPWYGASLLFFLCCLPYSDLNAVWRGVFLAYTLIGTELEERKFIRDLGTAYEDYRRGVPRFFPLPWTRRGP